MKKKVLAALLLSMCITLAGCGQEAEEKTTGTTTEAAGTEAAGTEAAGTEAGDTADAVVGSEPTYKALDYVELGQYKDLEFTIPSKVITKEDMDEQIYKDCQLNGMLDQVTEGVTVEDGDTINIDYVGKIDGVEFDGGADKGYDLTIGSGTFIAGFEEALIGAEAGKTVDIEVTFPENYSSNPDLAGKDAVFTVTVNYVNRIPELTTEVIEKISIYSDLAKYLGGVKAVVEEVKADEVNTEAYSTLIDLLYSGAVVLGYPADVVDYRYAQTQAYYQAYADEYGLEFADFLAQAFETTEEEFEEVYRGYIMQSMIPEMLLFAVGEAEGIEISDEEYEAGLEEYATAQGYETTEDLLAEKSEYSVRMSMLIDKVYEYLLDVSYITEETVEETEYVLNGVSASDEERARAEAATEGTSEEATEGTSEEATEGASEETTEETTTEAVTEEETTEAGTDK